jgi:enamine deaminase RidA (YjgF/YER057c/UK114 family)
MSTVLESAGGSLSDIVSIVVYTTDIRQFKEIVAASRVLQGQAADERHRG